MSDDIPLWAFRSITPVPIERRRLEDEPDLAPDAAIVGAFLDGRLIARVAADADWTPEDDHGLLDVPRVISYTAREVEGGTIRAELCAVIPAQDLPREPWQPEPEEDTPEGLMLLGIVLRLSHERSKGEFTEECLDHFMMIMKMGAESVVDRLLKSV